MIRREKVIIIGAGPAGLTAAYELLAQGNDQYDVWLLEESDAFGGISQTVRHGGNRMDIGGHRFFSKDARVMQWWVDQMPVQGAPPKDDRLLHRNIPVEENGPDPEMEDRVMLVRHRVSRIFYGGKFFDYPISMKWQTIKNLGFFTTMKAGFSYLYSCLKKRPENSLEDFYINRFGQVLYAMFFEGYTEKLWGRPPKDISADWGAQRVKGLSVKAVLKDMFSKVLGAKNRDVETSLIEQFYYPKYGPGQLWELVAEEIRGKGGTILTRTRAEEFFLSGNKIISVKTSAGETLKGDIFLSSMPVKDLVAGLPDADETIQAIAAGLPYRDFITVGLLVDRLLLKNETDTPTLGNIVPDCWIYVQDTRVKLGRIQIFNNWSPYMVKDAENTVWIGLEYFCEEGDSFWNKSREEMIAFAIDELKSMQVIAPDATPLDSHMEKVKKAYPAYFDTYDQMPVLTDWLNTHPNLYCIGRNGQHRYNNMDHSMATSYEAVQNILSGRQDKENVWNVNTEQSYHEKN